MRGNTPHLAVTQQRELIARYCGGIAVKIREASSREHAATLVHEACQGFARECPSEILRLFLDNYVADLFKQSWKREG